MDVKTLSDLPHVPLYKIFSYLSDLEIYHIGQTGNDYLHEIVTNIVQLGKTENILKDGKCRFIIIIYYIASRNWTVKWK